MLLYMTIIARKVAICYDIFIICDLTLQFTYLLHGT